MIIAAISTADGAEPGMPSASAGMMWPGIDAMSPVSAAIRPSIEPLPNCSFSLLVAFAAAYDIQAPESSPTPGRRPVSTPITPERSTVRQYCATSRKRGRTESLSSTSLRSTGSASTVSTSAKPNAPTSAGISAMPPDELVPAEGEAVVRVQALLADLRDEQAERAHQPALERVVADEAARHRHAEQREPEEFERAERQSDFGQRRRERGEAQHAEQRAQNAPEVAMPIARPASPRRASA